jgi:hypothetical protein
MPSAGILPLQIGGQGQVEAKYRRNLPAGLLRGLAKFGFQSIPGSLLAIIPL